VIDHAWLQSNGTNDYVLGSILQNPLTAVGNAGTYDFGISVQPLGNGTQELRVRLIKSDKSYSWAAKTIDFHSPNATDTFNSINFALNKTAATTMKIEAVQVDLGAPIDLPDWVVAVESPVIDEIPTSYALNQNYPNPFNPTTMIEVSLPQRGKMNLVVYNTLGKVVAELANGEFAAGRHQFNFNAVGLPSGVYFYRLKAGDFSSTKKLMLVK